jgi:uncharacterized membrane protein
VSHLAFYQPDSPKAALFEFPFRYGGGLCQTLGQNMKTYLPVSIFFLVEIMVVVFILSTVGVLPENIASHFNGAGVPNGFMSKEGYIQFMLLFAVGIPTLTVCSISFAMSFASASINIPNKEYWLSVQNRTQTILFLKSQVAYLGILIASFIAYIHWLLLKANSTQPPQLPNSLFFVGMSVFLLSILWWGLWLVLKFVRVPKD